MIKVKNLHKKFDDLEVLSGIDEHITQGEVVVVIGPSGSGGQDGDGAAGRDPAPRQAVGRSGLVSTKRNMGTHWQASIRGVSDFLPFFHRCPAFFSDFPSRRYKKGVAAQLLVLLQLPFLKREGIN